MDDSKSQETAQNSTEEPKSVIPDLQVLAQQWQEMFEYFRCYLKFQVDQKTFSFKELLSRLILAIIGIFVTSGSLLLGAAFTVYGIAIGLAKLTPEWAGFLLAGCFCLSLTLFLSRYKKNKEKRSTFNKRLKEYEKIIQNQKTKFGRSMEPAEATPK